MMEPDIVREAPECDVDTGECPWDCDICWPEDGCWDDDE